MLETLVSRLSMKAALCSRNIIIFVIPKDLLPFARHGL